MLRSIYYAVAPTDVSSFASSNCEKELYEGVDRLMVRHGYALAIDTHSHLTMLTTLLDSELPRFTMSFWILMMSSSTAKFKDRSILTAVH